MYRSAVINQLSRGLRHFVKANRASLERTTELSNGARSILSAASVGRQPAFENAIRFCSSGGKPPKEGVMNYAVIIGSIGTACYLTYICSSAVGLVKDIYAFQRFSPLTDPKHGIYLEKKNK